MDPEIRLKELTTGEVVGPYLSALSAVWTGADERRLREILPRHAEREAFRFLAAQSGDGRLEGFAYGYVGAPGQWWHDIVSAAMDEQTRERWLPAGHFEVVELHVHPDSQRRGIGGRLHDALLDGLANPTAVLSTQKDNGPALALYQDRGWQVVVPELFFGTDPSRPFCVMGRDIG